MRIRSLIGTCLNIITGKVIARPEDPTPADATVGMLVPNEPVEYLIEGGVISGDIVAPATYTFTVFNETERVFSFRAVVPEDPDGPPTIRFEEIYASQTGVLPVRPYIMYQRNSILLLAPGGGTSSQFLGQTGGVLEWRGLAGTHEHPISEVDGLQEVLNEKTDIGHQHQLSDIDGLEDALDAKASAQSLSDEVTARIAEDTAILAALDTKLGLSGGTMLGMLTLLANPTNPLHAATKAYVDAAVAALVASSPSTLDTLDELAAALGDDPNFATTVSANIGTKLAKSANLSDLTNVIAARTNLGLGAAAVLAVGMVAGTVAAGDDARFLTTVEKGDLTDGGESTLHYHASDRDRSNHTGTQPASTISDLATTILPVPGVLTDGPTITWAWSYAAKNKTVTLGGNRALTITGLVDSADGLLKVRQDATGSRTLTITVSSPSMTVKVVNAGAGAVTLSSAANAEDLIAFAVFGTTVYITIGRGYT